MSMHLEGPWLSLNGKKKGKIKFRTAEEARRARELDASWSDLKQKWGAENTKKKSSKQVFETLTSPKVHIRDTGPRPASLNPADMSPATKKQTPVYTGTKMLGIGTMHKSNSVPIFSNDEAIEISKMRRN